MGKFQIGRSLNKHIIGVIKVPKLEKNSLNGVHLIEFSFCWFILKNRLIVQILLMFKNKLFELKCSMIMMIAQFRPFVAMKSLPQFG